MKHTIALLFGLFLAGQAFLHAQNACNLTVDAGADVTICEGENTTLNGVVSGGNNPTVLWTPAAGLSNPAIPNPVASPTVTTTYTLTVSATSDNLIVNGGFETGDIAPSTSNYTQVADPVAIATNAPNFYGILSVPQIVQAFGCTPDIGDYTMVIHGSTSANTTFWCQTVDVTPNTDYKLSFKVFGIPYFFAPAPNIVMRINGTQVGNITAPNGLCAEASGNFTWNSGAATTAQVCLANATVAGLGSMCSVDDITMVECCEVTDQVTVTVAANSTENLSEIICPGGFVEVGGQQFGDAGQYQVVLDNYLGCDSTINLSLEVAEIEPFIDISNALTCLLNQATLDGSLSNGTFGIQSYFWSTVNGNIVSNPTLPAVTVNAPGQYTLTVTTSNGVINCSDALTITVPIDTVSPVFGLDPPPVADCQDTLFTLRAFPIAVPPGATLQWTSPNGIILSGGQTYEPTVQGTGNYVFTVTNPGNGCTASDSLQIQAGGDLPLAQLLAVPTLSCRDSQGVIEILVVQPDSGFTLLWTTPDGNILSGANSASPLVNQPGTYQLLLTDTLSGCFNTLQATVIGDFDLPLIDLAASDTLSCLEDSLLLVATLAPGLDSLAIAWTTANGLILSGADSLLAWVGAAGTYRLSVENLRNGCVADSSITVVPNADAPPVQAGPDLTIDCGAATVSPDPTGTAQGPEFSYRWTTLSGQISNDTLLVPVFTAGGIYILTVTNALNGCTASDTVLVFQNGDVPGVLIDPPATLTCLVQQVTLSASITAIGTTQIVWTGPAGGILSGGNTPSPLINQPGWYVLTVTDLQSQCVATDSVLVIQDIAAPTVQIATPGDLDCNTPSITLDAFASGPAGQVQFAWTTQGGNIVSGAATASPVVNSGGTYTLTLTNTANGCTATASVTVNQDPNLPTVSIATPDTLTCLVSSVVLSASAGTPPPGSQLLWTTTNGQIDGPADGLTATVSRPGTYVFTLTLPGGACTATDQVTVVADTLAPVVSVALPGPLTCSQTSLTLSAQPLAFTGPLDYVWRQGGATLGTGASVTIQSPGALTLRWTVPGTGCSDSLTLNILEDTAAPLADAGPDLPLPCGGGQVTLDGSASSGQGPLGFVWTTLNGQILSGANTAQPAVGSPGTYTLTVTDPLNGCTASDVVQVISQGGTGSFTLEVSTPFCRGAAGSLTLNAGAGGTPPYTMTITGVPGSFSPGQPATLFAGQWPVRIEDGAGCLFDTLLFLADGPPLLLNAPTEVAITSGGSATVTLSGNFGAGDIASLTWEPDQFVSATATPLVWTLAPPEDRFYRVFLTTTEGCEASAGIQVRVNDLRLLYVPNAFSPNNVDGINDRFFPYSNSAGFQTVQRMAIYDRWGNQLFEREDFPVGDAEQGWDGTYRGRKLDPGVYVWVIEVARGEGQVRVYKGEVTLF